MTMLHERFFDVAARFGSRSFLAAPADAERRWAPEGVQYTYAQGAARVAQLATIYRDAGLGVGHRVALSIDNHPDFFLHKLALVTLGASVVPLNPDWRHIELRWVLELTAPSFVVAFADHREALEATAATLDLRPQVIDFTTFDQGLPMVHSRPLDEPITTATETLVLFTSGTTGRSKGCRWTHEYELALGDWYRTMGGLARIEEGVETLYNPLPVYHSDCSVRAFHEMMPNGGCLVTTDRFRAGRYWHDVRESGATMLHYLGVVTSMLMAQPPSPLDRQHRVRLAIGGGADPTLHAAFEARFGFPLLEVWGMTECMRVLIDCHPPRTVGQRAVGRPRAGLDVRVVDDDDQEVPRGQTGELCVRHSAATPRRGLFAGYLKDPEATETAWRGGWFHTGDFVRQDHSDLVFFVDRKKHIIRRSGENIAAAELDAVLLTHPQVAQVAVVPVLDELRGEEVMACVVPKPEATRGRALAESLFEHVQSQLAWFKAPGWVVFLDDLPRTGSQKIQKFAVFPAGVDGRKTPGAIDLRDRKKRPER